MLPFLCPDPERHKKVLLKSLKQALREIRIINPVADSAATKCAAIMKMLVEADYERLERIESLLDRIITEGQLRPLSPSFLFEEVRRSKS